MAVRAETQVDLNRIDDGSPGAQGTTFTPSVNADGDISWTNDGGLPNPTTRNIKGPQGPEGPQGPTGPAGPGVTYITLQNGDDLNNCITKGNVYVTASTAVCTSLLNAPTGKPDGELQLEVQWLGSDNYLVQRLTCKNGATRKVYLRTYSSGTFGEWTEEGVPYGTSSTAAGTAAKTASIDNWDRGSNQYVAIKFTNENTASNPTLNINSTGAAQIMTNGSNSAYWEAGSVVNFYWDGTYYQVANTPVYASTVTVGNPSQSHVYIGNNAVEIKYGSTVMSKFGSDIMLGQPGDAHVLIDYDKFAIRYPGMGGEDIDGGVIGGIYNATGYPGMYLLASEDSAHWAQLELDPHAHYIDLRQNNGGTGSSIKLDSSGSILLNNSVLADFVTEKGTKTGGWYYEKWSSGKIEAWGSVSTGTLPTMSGGNRVYMATGVNGSIPSGIFSSTPSFIEAFCHYSNAACYSVWASPTSSTAFKMQVVKNANNTNSIDVQIHAVYYPSTY